MRGAGEWATIIVIAASAFGYVWLRKRQKAQAVRLGMVKEVDEASARVGAYASTAVGGLLFGLFFYHYHRGNIPPQNAPLVWFFVALVLLWVFFKWFRWLRLRRR